MRSVSSSSVRARGAVVIVCVCVCVCELVGGWLGIHDICCECVCLCVDRSFSSSNKLQFTRQRALRKEALVNPLCVVNHSGVCICLCACVFIDMCTYL